MTLKTFLLTGTATALLATSAVAQTALTASGAEDRIDTLNESITDDFERDFEPFGNEGRALGFTGSMALQANATSGNTETRNLGIGANFGYYDGTNGYELQLSYQFSEDEGDVSEDSLLYELEYTRDFSSAYYGFAKLQGTVDSFPSDTSDNFLGAGIGYRIYNTRDIQWDVQAGVGYRVADLNGVDDLDEGALALSSSYYNQINESLALTMDTDVIGSESGTRIFNDLGVNVSMTETLALRTSLITEFDTDPAPGVEDTDNALGVSLVYNFN
ncbi:DUF481 domain-containing protein [Pseudooctadecabacter jejudonensis]|uniref:Salt-induced outer membrane protein n=1 Tax=Pseudooctadecabacter jejudonensis TaxID=1391910 RepID=A0A1Y5RLG0_9RHOB|nr:DUF481 domain-containing protein [Pseudooctadecabacter jejudonensis]SLN20281.1 hypothetical protein PSJ8397_00745 [Pseudooctadecabacter jejudonensis]